jgi:hypothetical protein
MVVMDISATNSNLSDTESIPISFGPNGEVISQPVINTINAETTVMARSGQTVILGGLIRKVRDYQTRRVPYLSDIPILGRIFRYDSANEDRSELLIIMTPHIIRNEADADWLRQVESDRMSWCLADVIEMHGNAGLSGGYGLWGPSDSPVIFPDVDPTGMGGAGGFGGMGDCEMIVPSTLQEVPLGAPVPSTLRPAGPLPTEVPGAEPGSVLSPPGAPQGATSTRRKPIPADPPLPTASAPRTGSRWPWIANTGARVEKSDNATVIYGPPPKQYGAPALAPLPQQSEVAPAYFQQSPQSGNYGGAYQPGAYQPGAVQPADWPAR